MFEPESVTQAATEAAGNATNSLNSLGSTLDILLVVLLIGAGLYAIYVAIKLRVKCELFKSRFLYPGNCPPEECTDPAGFMTFAFPRLLILGIACVILGALTGVYKLAGAALYPEWVDLYVVPAVALGVFAWYIVAQRKASKLFW